MRSFNLGGEERKESDDVQADLGLPASVAKVFTVRNIKTAKDAMSLSEFDLMELSGLGLDQVRSAVLRFSAELSPPCQTGLSLWEKRLQKEQWGGHLPTRLKGLDTFRRYHGSRRPCWHCWERINILMLQRRVKLLVIHSMTALVSGSAAEASRVPILMTNQVRSQRPNEVVLYNFEAGMRQEYLWGPPDFDYCLVAASGVQWSHAVTIRLILEAISGQSFMKVAKSPMSPPVAFPFSIISSGISLLDDCGRELVGKQIYGISCQGHNEFPSSEVEDVKHENLEACVNRRNVKISW